MEGKEIITIRVSKKMKDLYKNVSYTKSKVLKNFRKKYIDKYKEYVEKFENFEKIPPSVIGGKYSIISPVNLKDKNEFKAFAGYMIEVLKNTEGDVFKAIKFIREDLDL